MVNYDPHDTICALSTPPGTGALAIIRISGKEAHRITRQIFSKDPGKTQGHTLLFGKITDGEELIDEVLVSVFRAPHSFTGEDSVEISCHGSPWIQSRILHMLIDRGCRMARPGEFSMRAFANGKMDLSQAEAIADLIASTSRAAHRLAMNQMKGGFSRRINTLREELIHFASMVELELDFSEEDVEFADRAGLTRLVEGIRAMVRHLMDSFAAGNAIKNGIPVAILGAPNMGKSTLLNVLLEDERAIVSEIAGTTRDTIEDEMTIDGIRFRFTDTAGIRETTDEIETIGITRALDKAGKSAVVIYLFDAITATGQSLDKELRDLRARIGEAPLIIPTGNKIDRALAELEAPPLPDGYGDPVLISATRHIGIDTLRSRLVAAAANLTHEGDDVVVSNLRHYEALAHAATALDAVTSGLSSGISGDFLAIDIRRALHYLGEITGEITTDDLLGNIFSKFCIGK